MEVVATDQSSINAPQSVGPPRHATRWMLRAMVVACLCWLAWREWYFSGWMDDDAFISFRYARNLARGIGLVFNPDERVEGYTNFLWTVLLAGLHRLGADLPLAAQVAGAFCSFLTIALLLVFGRGLLPRTESELVAARPWLGSLAGILLCLLEPWAAWAVGGLENPLGTVLVLAAFLSYFRAMTAAGANMALPGLFSALASLANPSFALFGLVLGAHLLARTIRGRASPRALGAFVSPILVIGLPFLAWKYAYYGRLLPNTFHAKVGFRWAVLARGGRYFVEVLTGLPMLSLAVLAAPVLLRGIRPRDARPWLLWFAIVGYSAYALAIGGEAFPAFRILIVTLPLQLLLVQYLLAHVMAGIVRRFPATPAAIVLSAALLALVPGYISARVRVIDEAIDADYLVRIRATALQLRERFPHDILLAGSGAGVIPFYSEFRFLDTLGLTDAHIAARNVDDFGAKTAGHEKGDGRYVLERAPDVIMFNSGPVSGFDPAFLSDYELVALPEFHERYDRMVLLIYYTPRNRGDSIGVYAPIYVKKGTQTR